MDHFDDFFQLLPTRGDSDRSWTVTGEEEVEARNYDLKAVNPNAKANEDLRKPAYARNISNRYFFIDFLTPTQSCTIRLRVLSVYNNKEFASLALLPCRLLNK